MAQMVSTKRLVDGRYTFTFLREAETGHLVIITPVNFWRRRKRKAESGVSPALSPGDDAEAAAREWYDSYWASRPPAERRTRKTFEAWWALR